MKRIALLAVFAALLSLGSAAFAGEQCTCKAQTTTQHIGLTELEMSR